MRGAAARDVIDAAPSQPLAAMIYQGLEGMIVRGDLKAGDRINEMALASRQGVSRGPVREACRRLEEAGLVEFRVNRGFFVRQLVIEDVLELYEVRAALFSHAGLLLASTVTGAQLAELEGLHRRMGEATAAGDMDVFYAMNREFHGRIMAFTGNRRLAQIYEGLDRELHIWRRRALILDGNMRASLLEHEHILAVLKGGNPTLIAQVLREHSLAGRNRLVRTLSEPA
ncbi:MAG TPA: FCD domain-containing protein [Microvirga sp.]|jgi:DNA-binding GntR family transcriptional regulator|nr:FCD domain-containing protein [Microvirga sp.]